MSAIVDTQKTQLNISQQVTRNGFQESPCDDPQKIE
jgi:hypothetical protein